MYTVGLRSVLHKQWRGFVGMAKVNLVAIELPVRAMARTSRRCLHWPSCSTTQTCTLFLLQYQKSSSNWKWLVAYPHLGSATLLPRTQHDLAHCSLLVLSSRHPTHTNTYSWSESRSSLLRARTQAALSSRRAAH